MLTIAGQRAFLFPRELLVDLKSGALGKTWHALLARMLAATGVVESITAYTYLKDVPTRLDQKDAGLLISIAGYHHLLRWEGERWDFACGDVGNRFYRTFPAGLTPQEEGWHLCDGTTATYLVVGGAVLQTADFVTPVVANQYFRL
jgi:hypothetical protein